VQKEGCGRMLRRRRRRRSVGKTEMVETLH
jgi:hypothetical protein